MNKKTYMLLDIGNTDTKISIFKNNKIRKDTVIETNMTSPKEKLKTIIEVINEDKVNELIYTLRFNNSRDLWVIHKLQKHFKDQLVVKSAYMDLAMNSSDLVSDKIDPSSIGTDIYMGVKGAMKDHKDKNFMVIDMGTAITYTLVIDKKIQGINIAPGYTLSTIALLDNTNLDIETIEKDLNENDKTILSSTNTGNAFINGTRTMMIENLLNQIDSFKEKYKLTNIFITGGDAYILESLKLPKYIVLEPLLIEKGLTTLIK